MFPRTANHLLPAICFAILLLSMPAQAQDLGLDLDVGGVSVDLDVGGSSGLDLDVDLGDDAGVDVDLGGTDSLDATVGGDSLTLSQEAALEAVRMRRALPLEDILLRAQLMTDGDVIDAQLIAVQDVLLYEIKVLSKAGNVSELYFYARSGLPVE